MQAVIGWALWFSSLAGISSGTLWQLTLLSPQNGAIISEVPQDSISVSGGFYRPNNGIPPIKGNVSCNGVAGTINTTTRTWTVTSVHLNPGINAITCQYNEKNDVSIAQIQVTYQGGATLPPIAGFQYSPSTGTAPLFVSFDASESYDPDGGNVVSYEWIFGDGATLITYSPVVAHTYLGVGIFYTQLQVRDDEGILSDPVVYSIETYHPNLPPVAQIASNPSTGFAPLNVQFDASASSDPDGQIVSYFWNFSDGNTATTTSPIITHVFNQIGSQTVTLRVTDNNGSTNEITTNITVTDQYSGKVSGITAKTSGEVVANVTLTLTSSNFTLTTTSDAVGKYSFNLMIPDGAFVISALTSDGFISRGKGSIAYSNPTTEVAMIFNKDGNGKFSGKAVMASNTTIAVPDARIVIRSYDNSYEAFTVTGSDGTFIFDHLPLVGRYYTALFHADGRSRASGFVISSAQPEIVNNNFTVANPTYFPYFSNGSFNTGQWDDWFGSGYSDLLPQSGAFNAKAKASSHGLAGRVNPTPYYFPEEWYERDAPLPPRSRKKNKLQESDKGFEEINTSCESKNFAAITASTWGTVGSLEQSITIEDDAETLVGRVRFLTNESAEDAELGYNDTFNVLFQNPIRSQHLKIGDVKNVTWGPGALGFERATQEIDIAVDLRDLRGQKAKLSFIVFDRGDGEVDSGIVVSNFHILKTSDKYVLGSGVWAGDSTYSNSMGEVSWFTVTNPNEMSGINISNSDFNVLAKNQTVRVPTVKFGNEPLARNFNVDTFLSTDIFNYNVESTWIPGMPTNSCGAL